MASGLPKALAGVCGARESEWWALGYSFFVDTQSDLLHEIKQDNEWEPVQLLTPQTWPWVVTPSPRGQRCLCEL